MKLYPYVRPHQDCSCGFCRAFDSMSKEEYLAECVRLTGRDSPRVIPCPVVPAQRVDVVVAGAPSNGNTGVYQVAVEKRFGLTIYQYSDVLAALTAVHRAIADGYKATIVKVAL